MSDRRLSDDEFAELDKALGFMYEVGEPPPGTPEWVVEFLGPDGGHLNAFAAWRQERARWESERRRADVSEGQAAKYADLWARAEAKLSAVRELLDPDDTSRDIVDQIRFFLDERGNPTDG